MIYNHKKILQLLTFAIEITQKQIGLLFQHVFKNIQNHFVLHNL